MRIGVVSDTHGHVEFTREAVRMLESLEVEQVLHCGDIGSAEIPTLFSAWPTHFVRGNVDAREQPLQEAIAAIAGHHYYGRFGQLTLAETPIALLHGDDPRRYAAAVESGDYRLICSGHTHRAAVEKRGDCLLLNPGAIYRANPHTCAVVELPACTATTIELRRHGL